jgi:hypothetical protein
MGLLLPTVAILGTAVFAGCSKEPESPTLLQARPQPYIPDVPVPHKFQRDERKSSYTSTAGHREVRDVYQGKEPSLAVRNFYLHYMAPAGWELIDDQLQNGVYVLNYRKDMEKCEVRIERIPNGSYGTVTQTRVVILPQ